jgi:hypothetical protein
MQGTSLNTLACTVACAARAAWLRVTLRAGEAFPFFKPNFTRMESYRADMGADDVSRPPLACSIMCTVCEACVCEAQRV